MTTLDQFRLDSRCAIVTGGAGLLGQQFCRCLAEAGANVIVADLAGDKAEAVAADLRAKAMAAQAVAVDITRPDSVQHLVQEAGRLFGEPSVLVNSAAMDPKFDPAAGVAHRNTFEDYPLELWRQALDVNLTGMFLVTQAVARRMALARKGSIVNICSTYGLVGPDQRLYERPGEPPRFKPVYYSVTKAAVLGFTRYLATYFAGTELRVNALTPGGIFNEHDEIFTRQYSARTVMGRMGRRDEMNGALLYLASDASSYMTGANLVVDGGWTAW